MRPPEHLAARIERLVLAPDEVRDTLGRLAGPLLRALGWKPSLSSAALSALVTAPRADRERLFERACDELEENLESVERACVVHGRPPLGHATWLWRCLALLSQIGQAGSTPASRAIAHGDPLLLLPPPPIEASALVRVDLLLEAARHEPELLGRRRVLLEAARRMLLDAAAARGIDRAHVGPRAAYIARSIEEIDRLEAAGVAPARGLLHQARGALRRGERDRLRACLVAVDAVARRRGDGRLATLAARALELEGGDPLSSDADARRASVHRSALEAFGAPLLAEVEGGLASGRERARAALASAGPETADRLRRAEAYLGEGAEGELLSCALAVDGLFDVGGAATPVRVVEEETRRQVVRHPATELALVPAQRVEDLKDAVLSDPRAVLFQLAEGTLLARRYVEDEVRRHTRTRLATELRIYVADGSSSMLGPRARMRDAILLAELATLIGRLRQPDRFLSPILEMRFFDDELGPITRVSTVDEGLAAIADIFATPRLGGTNIQRALLGSLEQVRARSGDASLESAQIVLVTDGLSKIDPATLRAARDASGALPIRLSIIALGVENPALSELAAEQRARGERVFYHFVDDAELTRLTEGGLEHRIVLHAASSLGDSGAVEQEAPVALVEELVGEMEALERARREGTRVRLEGHSSLDASSAQALVDAAGELDLALADLFCDGAQARLALLDRDERALALRFERWFPPRASSARPTPIAGSPGADRVALARILIATTCEVIEQVSGSPAARLAEAIAIFERLLYEHGMPPWNYAELLRDHGGEMEPELRALRELTCDQGAR